MAATAATTAPTAAIEEMSATFNPPLAGLVAVRSSTLLPEVDGGEMALFGSDGGRSAIGEAAEKAVRVFCKKSECDGIPNGYC
jgi:hypothetical protein